MSLCQPCLSLNTAFLTQQELIGRCARALQEEIKNELAVKKVFLQGCDNAGRGIILLLAARHSKSTRDLDETKRFICYCLEQQCQLHDPLRNPDGKGVGIFDMRGTLLLPPSMQIAFYTNQTMCTACTEIKLKCP